MGRSTCDSVGWRPDNGMVRKGLGEGCVGRGGWTAGTVAAGGWCAGLGGGGGWSASDAARCEDQGGGFGASR